MSFAQLGNSSISSPQLLMSTPATSISTSCCENGRPIVTDPHTGQSVCSCQYGSSLLSYSRVPGLAESMYSTSPYTGPQSYMSLGTDPSAFYSPLNAHYDLKENGETWRSLTQHGITYPYDPTMAAYSYANTYGGMDLNAAARRKNATRETTNTLKAWLYEHIKNPYPTKGEKIMLAIITKMTLTQVSTWFANARRRLKKENKMTWSPRNRSGEDNDDSGDEKNDDDDDIDDKDKARDSTIELLPKKDGEKKDNEDKMLLKDTKPTVNGHLDDFTRTKLGSPCFSPTSASSYISEGSLSQTTNMNNHSPCSNSNDSALGDIGHRTPSNTDSSPNSLFQSANDQSPGSRPRIWSLANVATSNSSSLFNTVSQSSAERPSLGIGSGTWSRFPSNNLFPSSPYSSYPLDQTRNKDISGTTPPNSFSLGSGSSVFKHYNPMSSLYSSTRDFSSSSSSTGANPKSITT